MSSAASIDNEASRLHRTPRAAPGHLQAPPEHSPFGGSKFTGVVVPNVFPPCRNHSRQCGGQRRRLGKNISSAPDASTVQAHNRACRTHLPRIPIQPGLPERLSCSRPKLASARPKLASTYRMRLRRAACAAAAGLLQARIVHHDCAAAPHRLLSPAPLSLKTVRCAAAACRGPRVVFGLQIQPQGDACTGTLLSIVAERKAKMPISRPSKHWLLWRR